jgi:MFS family permease
MAARGLLHGRWALLAVLCAAQFVMVLDSSVMNVSISQIVADLDTTIQGVQLAITAYTLVMAAFMLVGARLGDIWGRDRAFAIGLAVYGIGSMTTALSPSLPVLLVGWSLVEGLGAVLVIPAIAALIVSHYEGKDRALAYGLIGGVSGAAVAAGPLIGGWVTTTFSWRWVFAAETVVVVAILLVRRWMPAAPPRSGRRPQLDVVGAALSAAGLGLIVFAILQTST